MLPNPTGLRRDRDSEGRKLLGNRNALPLEFQEKPEIRIPWKKYMFSFFYTLRDKLRQNMKKEKFIFWALIRLFPSF